MIEILILSLVQGLTEFLPISSSSHLIIISNFFEFKNQGLVLDVGLHIGSFFAVIAYFRQDILDFVINKRLFLKILCGTIPVMIVGYLFVVFNVVDHLRNFKIIGWTTLIFGILLYLSDQFKTDKEIQKHLSFKLIIIIGIAQILSLVPGVSRSGITITSARFLKFKRVDSAKISFLLSIPTLALVSLYGLNSLIESNNLDFSILFISSIIFSFIFSYITINYFLKFIKRFNLNFFVLYRIFLGVIILIIAYL